MAPLKATLMLSDGLSAFVVFLVLVNVRLDVLGGTWSVSTARPVELAGAYGIMWVTSLWLLGLYRLRTHWTLRAEIVDVLRAAVVMIGGSVSILYVFDLTAVSRLFLAMLFVTQPAVTIVMRTLLRKLLENLRSRGQMRREMLVIGSGPEAQAFADNVERHRELGLNVMGHVSGPGQGGDAVTRPLIGTLDDIDAILHSRVVDEVAIVLSPSDWVYVEPATRICEEEGKIVRVSIQPLGGVLTGGQYEELGTTPVMTFLRGPDRMVGLAIKRITDVVFSALALVVLSPVMLIVALAIRLIDRPGVIFRQERVGLHGRTFTCFKFRTMVPDAEERYAALSHLSDVRGPAFKMENDPRVTGIGRFLRRTGLDELPQLVNVLRGEMSIVGPRPAPPREVAGYSIWHRRRLMMRPGLTGYWQVEARADNTDFDRRAQLDLQYIDRWSLWMDVKIILRTIPAIMSQEGR
jgi:exopolysaccharide biosynthesis polyprenyl glycosylphosphotransferase